MPTDDHQTAAPVDVSEAEIGAAHTAYLARNLRAASTPAPPEPPAGMAEGERLVTNLSASSEATGIASGEGNYDKRAHFEKGLQRDRRDLLSAVRSILTRAETAEAVATDAADYAHKLQIALTGLALGGSENFVRYGDSFRADIMACTQKIQRRFDDTMESLKEQLRARRTAEAALASLRAEREVPVDLYDQCRKFVEEQSVGEWGDELVAKDAAALEHFVRTLISAQKEPRNG